VHNQKKSLEETIQDEEAAIADVTEAISTLEPLAKLIKEVLGEKIVKVAVISRKADSPCIRNKNQDVLQPDAFHSASLSGLRLASWTSRTPSDS